MYEAVTAYPAGDSTVSRQAATAADYGYSGLVVRTREADFDADAINDPYGVDAVRGIEIDAADPESAAGSVGNHRRDCTVLLVRGGTDALNRYAVETDRIDVLSRPMTGDGDFNHVLAKAAKTHNVHVEFDFGPVLRSSGGRRVQAIQRLRKLRELVEQYDTPFVVSVGADSHRQLRAPRELRAVGEQIGFEASQITAGLEAWGEIVARNRERQGEDFIEPGVRRGRYEP
ncbi:ribonuclease P [Halonotius terrestris]|uniref:Ribonuclease P protein component 3 n=1 Tax=Halonotius terrestris TaxID=2487750 RepID=A0A8J8TBZ6_9EURY|nr:RNase P subunit p30 family protein [Halonotius terrestris]TQQ79911.1 ribonuclease P [Halonotius terrestris]